MTGGPELTVIMATRNARPAVRLTLESLARYNPGNHNVFVADNGSTDGTLEDLRSRDDIHLISLSERVALETVQRERHAAALRAVSDDAPRVVQALSSAMPDTPVSAEELAEHGATLDWLLARVTTPYVLTLDSDVEFLGPGLLDGMMATARRHGLAALGVYEPGHSGYRCRLAPYVLLLHTATLRSLGASFRGGWRCDDPDERQRWLSYSQKFEITPEELVRFPKTRVYPTGAEVFEKLVERDLAWAALETDLSERFRHFGHQSWGGLEDEGGGSSAARLRHAAAQHTIVRALRAYDRSASR